jgi:hypothetical protein
MITRYRLTLINLFEQVHRVQTNPNNCLYECLDIQETLLKKKLLTLSEILGNVKQS